MESGKEARTTVSAAPSGRGWERRGPFGHRPKPGATPVSQMPSFLDPVELTLGGLKFMYSNGRWKPMGETEVTTGPIPPAIPGVGTPQEVFDQREINELRAENSRLAETNRRLEEEMYYLDFKVQLLTDMLAIKTLDLEKLRQTPSD